MKFAASGSKAVIFVTDDRKEDWWAEAHGKSLGPRPELIHEFIECGGGRLTFSTPDRFLKNADPKKLHPVSRESIAEVVAEKTSRESDMDIKRKIISHRISDVILSDVGDDISKYLSSTLSSIPVSKLGSVPESSRFSGSAIKDRFRAVHRKLFELEEERVVLNSQLDSLKEKIRDERARERSEVELVSIMDKINNTKNEISRLDDLVFQCEQWLLQLQRSLGDDV